MCFFVRSDIFTLFIFHSGNPTDSKNDGTFKVPGSEDATVEDVDDGPRMPNIGDMLKNVDVDSIMKNMDLGAMGNMMKGKYLPTLCLSFLAATFVVC